MNLTDLKKRVRSYTRDFSSSIFREDDIVAFINEGIERVQQVVPEVMSMEPLENNDDEVTYLPKNYHSLLALYSTFRCFAQDERHYQASTYNNEFETKLDELRTAIDEGRVVITDSNGAPVEVTYKEDYVVDNYFSGTGSLSDSDEGVEGVE